MPRQSEPGVDGIEVSAFTVPTSSPEADGTLEWRHTTIVLVEAVAGGVRGLGYTYADTATANLIERTLAGVVLGRNALDVQAAWIAMVRSIRNLGRPGISSMAIAAVDNALWDLKARILDLPLVKLLGQVRADIPVYGSGGFTSYSDEELECQLRGWISEGIDAVKMKIGAHPEADLGRVKAARRAIGTSATLMVDANGAYARKQALEMAARFSDEGVRWFEEPVSSDDLDGLRLLRERAPEGMEVAAGEYGYDAPYFRRMLQAQAVDVLQADATRCAGVTGFLGVDALCSAFCVPLSAHTAPTLHATACCAAVNARNVEYFYDHVRIEQMLFDGAVRTVHGAITPDLSRSGFGVELKSSDAERYRVYGHASTYHRGNTSLRAG